VGKEIAHVAPDAEKIYVRPDSEAHRDVAQAVAKGSISDHDEPAFGTHRVDHSKRGQKRLLVLVSFQACDVSDERCVWRKPKRDPRTSRRHGVTGQIDAVVNHVDLVRVEAHALDQKRLHLGSDSHDAMAESTQDAKETHVGRIHEREELVLDVDEPCASEPSGGPRIHQLGKMMRLNDVRSFTPEQPIEAQDQAPVEPCAATHDAGRQSSLRELLGQRSSHVYRVHRGPDRC
jgi:hypothetical protein